MRKLILADEKKSESIKTTQGEYLWCSARFEVNIHKTNNCRKDFLGHV